MSSLTYSGMPPPFELRSSLQGLQKPFSENWDVTNKSSSFLSDSSSMSTYLMICGDKKPNLFLKELILI